MAPIVAGDRLIDDGAAIGADTSILIELLRAGSALAIIFGGVFPYIPQYLTIKRTGSAEGFSLFVCLTLLMANILRILFWFGKRFEYPLLWQSIVMIVVMMVLVHGAVNSVSTKRKFADNPKFFRDMQVSEFWNWGDYRSYVECIISLTIIFSTATYALSSLNPAYMEAVGFLAVFIEACLGMPQFFRNCQKRSTAGMSVAMVAMWTSGDVFKTAYFKMREAPTQFFVCGALQIMVDLAILAQIVAYRRNSAASPSVPHSHTPASLGTSPAWPHRELGKNVV